MLRYIRNLCEIRHAIGCEFEQWCWLASVPASSPFRQRTVPARQPVFPLCPWLRGRPTFRAHAGVATPSNPGFAPTRTMVHATSRCAAVVVQRVHGEPELASTTGSRTRGISRKPMTRASDRQASACSTPSPRPRGRWRLKPMSRSGHAVVVDCPIPSPRPRGRRHLKPHGRLSKLCAQSPMQPATWPSAQAARLPM